MKTKRQTGFSLLELAIVLAIVMTLFLVAMPRFQRAEILASVSQANTDLGALQAGLNDYYTALISAGKEGAFPPAGHIAQDGWTAWQNATGSTSPNGNNENLHACSVIWVYGSFYDSKGDASLTNAAAPPTGTQHYDLRVMTSPIEALTSVPLDPFKNSGDFNSQYDYFGLNLSSEYVLRSLGPDRDADVGCHDAGFDCDCSSMCFQLGSSDPSRRVFDPAIDVEFECPGCQTLEEALHMGGAVYSPTNGSESTGDIFRTGVAPQAPKADLNGDGLVDFKDAAIFESQWRRQTEQPK